MPPTPTRTLTINAIPFRSSPLALPRSPFSPRLPITPPATKRTSISSSSNTSTNTTPRKRALATTPTTPLPPPPPPALRWIWQCHVCKSVYPLGATRRCLDDGHFFCSGTTTVSKGRKRRRGGASGSGKKQQACASEFDYSRWQAWGEWRRGVESAGAQTAAEAEEGEAVKGPRNCERNCDFPSECRWGKSVAAQMTGAGSGSSSPSTSPSTSSSTSPPPAEPTTPITSQAISCSLEFNLQLPPPPPPPTTFDALLTPAQEGQLSPRSSEDKAAREAFWDGILESARQRRGGLSGGSSSEKTGSLSSISSSSSSSSSSLNWTPSSPLARHPVLAEEEKEGDGNVTVVPGRVSVSQRILGGALEVLGGLAGSGSGSSGEGEKKGRRGSARLRGW